METPHSSPVSYSVKVFTSAEAKPGFYSCFSLVDSENFRMRDAQSGETNRTRGKNIFRSVRIGSLKPDFHSHLSPIADAIFR